MPGLSSFLQGFEQNTRGIPGMMQQQGLMALQLAQQKQNQLKQLEAQKQDKAFKTFDLGLKLADKDNPRAMRMQGLGMMKQSWSSLYPDADLSSLDNVNLNDKALNNALAQLRKHLDKVKKGEATRDSIPTFTRAVAEEYELNKEDTQDLVSAGKEASMALKESQDRVDAQVKQVQSDLKWKAEQDRLNQAYKIGERKEFKEGDQIVTREWDGKNWNLISTGERYKPPSTTVTVNTGEKAVSELNKELGKKFATKYDDVVLTANALRDLQEVKNLFNEGIVSGFGADWIVGAGKALKRLGINVAPETIANTEAFASLMGNQVGRIIKNFGAGTGLSDADREYAEKIVGGKITLNRESIQKIIDINEKAMRNVIQNYNKKAKEIMDKSGDSLLFDITVSEPGSNKSEWDSFWE